MKTVRGFALSEFLLVIVLCGTLIWLGLPLYKEYRDLARRQQAQAALLELAQNLEVIYGTNGHYAADDLRALLSEPPADYQITPGRIEPDQTFTLQAIPQKRMLNDPCGSYMLTHSGQLTHSETPTDGIRCL